MKLKKNTDLKLFMQTVRTCSCDVYYESQEGNRLNLNSTLSGYIFTASALDREFLEKGEIVCGDETDFKKIKAFVETNGI